MNDLVTVRPPPAKTNKERMRHIQETVALLPNEPGVYLFRDGLERIIYIGKATNLKSRVSSYFRPNAYDGRSNFRSIVRNT